MTNYTLSPLATAFIVACVLLVAALFVITILWQKYENLLGQQDETVRQATKRSVDQSRSTLKGQISEQMAPLLPGFPYFPADSRFLGNPIDYVVFNGYTALRDADAASGDLEIVLLDVKQGRSQLTAEQRAIGQAVEEGRIRFEVSRVDDNGTIETREWRPVRRADSRDARSTRL
jgi:predicted Holliday junction resolvase-like endonuclease